MRTPAPTTLRLVARRHVRETAGGRAPRRVSAGAAPSPKGHSSGGWWRRGAALHPAPTPHGIPTRGARQYGKKKGEVQPQRGKLVSAMRGSTAAAPFPRCPGGRAAGTALWGEGRRRGALARALAAAPRRRRRRRQWRGLGACAGQGGEGVGRGASHLARRGGTRIKRERRGVEVDDPSVHATTPLTCPPIHPPTHLPSPRHPQPARRAPRP